MELYQKPAGITTRWSSFENLTAEKGQAARTNRGGKGYAFDSIAAGQTRTLIDVKGSGTICRIWLTVGDKSPQMLRGLRIDMYWDGAKTPAVSAPLGDFFGIALGRQVAFESQLFSNPEGRSFNCFVPMPFRKSARITLTNELDIPQSHLFYDVNTLLNVPHNEEVLYFHAYWHRESPNALGNDLQVLPHLEGSGRYLGCNIGITANLAYEGSWWGEGEFKVWLDGDQEHPTLCGTGTEDFIGTAWGQGQYTHQTQGCPIADRDNWQWCFYRYHVPDPIYFDQNCRAVLQTIGGCNRFKAIELMEKGVPLIPVSVDAKGGGRFFRLLDQPTDLKDPSLPEGWCNFYRQDDWSSTAYFYLDRPENGLPALADVNTRTANLSQADENKRADT